MTTLLPGFEYQRVDVDGVGINCATAGSGPPVLLLHGYPQNHLMWRDVAPALAEDHTVVLADLRGYGDSAKPEPDAAGEVYSKRSMARDQVGLMRELGFARFELVGHDRGARVSHRLAQGFRRPRLPAGQRLAGIRHGRPRRGPAHRPFPPRRSPCPRHHGPARLHRLTGLRPSLMPRRPHARSSAVPATTTTM